jgi:hypothetical protein
MTQQPPLIRKKTPGLAGGFRFEWTISTHGGAESRPARHFAAASSAVFAGAAMASLIVWMK